MHSHNPISGPVFADLTSERQKQWRDLSTQYASICDAIARLGGAFGSEDQSAAQWSDFQKLLENIAQLRASSLRDIVHKVQAALQMLDETSDSIARKLLISVTDDLVVALRTDGRKF